MLPEPISRRAFTSVTTGLVLGASAEGALAGDSPDAPAIPKAVEAAFDRDYPAPTFKPSWKKPQIHRGLVQDFVIFAHSDLDLVARLLQKEPMLLDAAIDWGGGDWETGLGAASHMGRRDMVEFFLDRGARIDIFCAAMMGRLDAIRSFLTLQPHLIDARGPHGFSLHFHAQVGGAESEGVLDYLQSIKKIELKPNPFVKKPAEAPKPANG